MKRFAVVILSSIALLMALISTSSADTISNPGRAFDGWDADPISAVTIGSDGVATMQIQDYSDSITTINLSHQFTGVTGISFDINFINGDSRSAPPVEQGYIPNFLQVSFLTDSYQYNYPCYNKFAVYDPNTEQDVENGPIPGDWFHMDITNLGGIDGTLYFILQDMGDEYYSQGLVRNVIVTENQAAPVPEPSTMLLLGGGLVAVLLLRSRKMHLNG